MHKWIKEYVKCLDHQTVRHNKGNTLVLVGDKDSFFLDCVERKAQRLCLNTTRPDENLEFECPGTPIIVWDNDCKDKELRRKAVGAITPKYDIDRLVSPGLSCCADACLRIIRQSGIRKGCMIGVSGRGHAAQGLCDALAEESWSPVLVHSESDVPAKTAAYTLAKVIVSTSKWIVWPDKLATFKKGMSASWILDVSGSLDNLIREGGYISQREIGSLTISILLNRFARC